MDTPIEHKWLSVLAAILTEGRPPRLELDLCNHASDELKQAYRRGRAGPHPGGAGSRRLPLRAPLCILKRTAHNICKVKDHLAVADLGGRRPDRMETAFGPTKAARTDRRRPVLARTGTKTTRSWTPTTATCSTTCRSPQALPARSAPPGNRGAGCWWVLKTGARRRSTDWLCERSTHQSRGRVLAPIEVFSRTVKYEGHLHPQPKEE